MLQSRPPAPDCGRMSHRTAALRPGLGLTDLQTVEIRSLRRKGQPASAIAAVLDLELEDVERALLAMRTPKADRSRASLNVTLAARDFVHAQMQPGEAVHQTVDRLMGELEAFRGGAL